MKVPVNWADDDISTDCPIPFIGFIVPEDVPDTYWRERYLCERNAGGYSLPWLIALKHTALKEEEKYGPPEQQ